jgi:glutamate racemase
MSQGAIGVFDSGIGGLSVLRAIRTLMPDQDVLYFGDQGHVPYGPRPMSEVRRFSFAISQFLIQHGARLIVVACNTASAAALIELRQAFADVPFVGMEPAVKPAAEQTHTAKVGVLATPATFQGALYASVVERFAQGVEIYQDTCTGLVQEIEAGRLDGPETRRILNQALQPMLQAGIDTVVLGCTHYPLVIPQIQSICGPRVRVIDPAPAVARQTERLAEQISLQPRQGGCTTYFTSGDPQALRPLLGIFQAPPGSIQAISWQADFSISVSASAPKN